MFIDSKNLTTGQILETDICIIGAGAAGIAIAREFIGSSRNVIMLESGGLEYDKQTQSLYKGENTGLETFDLEVNRLRYFGGTTNHWAGHCRPLDPVDFEKKDWMPHSGWPITRSDLNSYYEKAQPILGLGEYNYENLSLYAEKTALPVLDFDEGRLITAVYNQSPPTRFGQEYREELRNASNVHVYLYANALELITNQTASRVSSIEVACIDGPRFTVNPRIVILATGGLENARILLLSNQISPAGIGNEYDLVGRFFMDHVLLRPGVDISFTRPGINLQLYRSLHNVAGGKMFAILAASEELLREERLANFRIHLVPASPKYNEPVGGVFSVLDVIQGENPAEKTANNSIAMHLVLEPFPNPVSRVSLSNHKDLFDQQKLQVNWQLTPAELTNSYRALELVALEFARMGLGRGYGAIFKDNTRWPDNLEAGRHHCGTTRMTDSPKTGVVNKNCRVFSVDNLYITGSSVFPTIGYANPTITIVALALRLVDHIKGLKS